jgi:membrane-associated protease RseP (regulator of RpoE activity)
MRMFSRSILTLVLAGAVCGAAATVARAQSGTRQVPGWLGVTIQDVTEELSESLPRGVHEGALVNGVIEGSPAEVAGLTEGDVIVKFDQTRVRNSGDLTEAVRNAEPGHVAVIEYYRDGSRLRAEAKLTKSKNAMVWRQQGEGRKHARRGKPEEVEMYDLDREHPGGYAFFLGDTPRLGVQLVDLTEQLSSHFGVKSGVLISEVIEESAAEAAGLKAGDIIVAVAGEPTESSQEVREALGEVDSGPVEITVMRDGKEVLLVAQLDAPKRARLSGFHGPSAPMFNIPLVGMDQEELKAEMEELREELRQLREELSQLRDDKK